MLNFIETGFDNYAELIPYFEKNNEFISNYGVVGTYIWQDYYRYRYAVIDGMLVMYGYDPDLDQHYYCYPLGDGDATAVLKKLVAEAEKPFYIALVPESAEKAVEELLGVKGVEAREEEDYLYSAEDLATLSGKKFHSQRNHINYFNEHYNSEFELLDKDNVKDIIPFLDKIQKQHPQSENTYFAERRALKSIVEDWEKLPVLGARLTVDGEMAAFCIGEICGEQLLVRSEKADKNIRGAYPSINRDFVAHFYKNGEGIKFVNREEDMGIEGLRKSKTEYHPIKLIKKFFFRVDEQRN